MSSLVALFLANSPWSHTYHAVWHVSVSIRVGEFVLDKSLLHWINDGLMAMFFFVAGLEIKREFLVGELSSLQQALLPVAAACGGMIVPAAFYLAFNPHPPESVGWGVPMATDIAFALGLFAMAARRVPASLRLFLMTLAVVDDLGAVLVIALFYTSTLSIPNLLVGGVFFASLWIANAFGIRHTLVYGVLGIGGMWVAFALSGVHATVAGVLAAFAIPARPHLPQRDFVRTGQRLLKEFDQAGQDHESPLQNSTRAETARALEIASDLAQTPLQRLEKALHPWAFFVIMPLFALANAGVTLDSETLPGLFQAMPLGIVIGLVLGKPLGILGATWTTVRSGLVALPKDISFRHIHAIGWLAGVGFTMSIFISNLAFQDSEHVAVAKVAVLAASMIAALVGVVLLRRV